jgi:hypothetical protein
VKRSLARKILYTLGLVAAAMMTVIALTPTLYILFGG